MIIRTYVFISTVFFTKTAGNSTQPAKAQSLIKVPCMNIRLHHCIKLQDPVAQFPGPFKTVHNQLLTDVKSPQISFYGIACIADVPAASNIVGMQYVESQNLSGILVFCHCRQGLAGKKLRSRLFIQKLLLGKSNTFFYHLIPD